MTVSKIIIAVEKENAIAEKAVAVGMNLANSLATSQVTIIHVIDPVLAIGNPDAGISPKQALSKLKEEGEAFLHHLRQPYAEQDNISCQLLTGKVVPELRQFTQRYRADILVIGIHYKRGFASLFGENLTKEIILKVSCPVLLTHVHPC
ncbi:MAG: universal stress protein [Microcystaceae cyanobacterium]